MREQLEKAIVAAGKRKLAAIPDLEPDTGETLIEASERAGENVTAIHRRLFSGFDLDFADINRVAMNYAQLVALYHAEFRSPVNLTGELAGGWAEGFLIGCLYMRELERLETETPAEVDRRAIPSESPIRVPRRFVVRRTLARVAAVIGGR